MNTDIHYYERQDGSVLSTFGLDTFLSVNLDTQRVFKQEGNCLKCIHDNYSQIRNYMLDLEESTAIILRAAEPHESQSIADLFNDYQDI